MIETDVCILGAGPGGVATALELDRQGIACTLLDQAHFPRDKVCGDALSGKVVDMLRRIDPALLEKFDQDEQTQVDSWGVRFIAPNLHPIVVPFAPDFDRHRDPAPGYIARREIFDNILVEEVRKRPGIDLREGVRIEQVQRENGAWVLEDKQQTLRVKARLLIAANGAQSRFAREVGGITLQPKHYAVAVRGYYRGVTGMDANNFIELHFLNEILPGYLWIFPLPNGEANVGVGMLKSALTRKQVNLKQAMHDLVTTHPNLRGRFEKAELLGPPKGFGLPLGSKRRSLSGEGYMLVGDAGALIDPFTGEGIGNAMLSGMYAAQQAARCLEQRAFSADFMAAYDASVYRAVEQELRLSRKLQQLAHFPSLFNLFAFFARRNQKLGETMSAMFLDLDLRSALLKPSFYFKLLFNQR